MKLDMKTAIIATVSVIIGGLAYAAITLQYANSRLEEQLQTAMSYQQQLQEQTELNTRQRLEFEARLVELEDDLLETASQVRSLDSALMEAEQRVNRSCQSTTPRTCWCFQCIFKSSNHAQDGRRSYCRAICRLS